jgi:ankyrin repeat protein
MLVEVGKIVGFNINAYGHGMNGRNALLMACANGHGSIVDMLLKHKAYVGAFELVTKFLFHNDYLGGFSTNRSNLLHSITSLLHFTLQKIALSKMMMMMTMAINAPFK